MLWVTVHAYSFQSFKHACEYLFLLLWSVAPFHMDTGKLHQPCANRKE